MPEADGLAKPRAEAAAWPTRPAPDIQSLADLASTDEVRVALAELAAPYGKVDAVTRLPDAAATGASTRQFIVEFARTQDAMAASSGWRCPLFGFSAVIVSLKRNGAGEPSASADG